DVSLVRIDIPEGHSANDFEAIAIDAEPIAPDESVLIAGITTGAFAEPTVADVEFHLTATLSVRAGVIPERIAAPPPFVGGEVLRLRMPILHGMSGGPVLRLAAGGCGCLPMTAVGVVSRGEFGVPDSPDHCADGEGWGIPIDPLLGMQARGETMLADYV